jgi:phosphocarrier protein
MEQFIVKVKAEAGLHARPASQLVKKATEFSSSVQIEKEDKTVDAKRLLSIMMLNIKQGESIKVLVQGEDEKIAAAAIKDMIEALE